MLMAMLRTADRMMRVTITRPATETAHTLLFAAQMSSSGREICWIFSQLLSFPITNESQVTVWGRMRVFEFKSLATGEISNWCLVNHTDAPSTCVSLSNSSGIRQANSEKLWLRHTFSVLPSLENERVPRSVFCSCIHQRRLRQIDLGISCRTDERNRSEGNMRESDGVNCAIPYMYSCCFHQIRWVNSLTEGERSRRWWWRAWLEWSLQITAWWGRFGRLHSLKSKVFVVLCPRNLCLQPQLILIMISDESVGERNVTC